MIIKRLIKIFVLNLIATACSGKEGSSIELSGLITQVLVSPCSRWMIMLDTVSKPMEVEESLYVVWLCQEDGMPV